MNTMDAIYRRQSAAAMSQDPVSKEHIEKLLGAAAQAPNHYKVRPWRFVVLTGEGRGKLGAVMAEILHRRFPDIDAAALEKERAKPLRSPVVIAVGVDSPSDPRVLRIENICAAAAACENLLLAAEELGLAGHWRTGDAARDAEVKRFLGFAKEQDLIAFLYIGYAENAAAAPKRPGFEDRTVWID